MVSHSLQDLSQKARKAIHAADTIAISAISCWETALLAKKGRLMLRIDSRRWIQNALKYPGLKVISLSPEILMESVFIENFHPDPADRMIVATALLHSLPLVTKDRKIHTWGGIKTIW